MADNETIADIIAEMRGMGNYQRYSGDHARVLAGRIEAAHRRERGNAAKLREALKAIGGLCAGLMPTWDGAVGRIKDMAETALAAPARNCDVGTAQEQIERWQAFCNRYDDDCTGCPCEAADTWNYTTCFAKWTQLPYEGGAK